MGMAKMMKKKFGPTKTVNAVRDLVDFHACPSGVVMEFLGISRHTLFNWHEEGAPQNVDGTWDTAALFNWRRERDQSKAKARGRTELEDAKLEKDIELKDLQIKRRKEQVIDLDVHLDILSRRIMAFKNYWLTTFHRELYRFVGRTIEEMHPIASQFVEEAISAYIAGSRAVDSEKHKTEGVV
jgi:phage terminase Nu1 subunit (DNA packaging protein)